MKRERETETETERQKEIQRQLILFLLTITSFVVACQTSIFKTAAHKPIWSIVALVTAVIVQAHVIGWEQRDRE